MAWCGNPSAQLDRVRSTCLYVATKLGDLLDDLVVVGGPVPSLLIDQVHLPAGAEQQIWVCGPGAFVILKVLTFDGRGENKDAYDLFYVIRNYGSGVDSVRDRLRPLLDDAEAAKAIAILKRDFSGGASVGPRRVAEFITGGVDATIQADAAGFVQRLMRGIGTS
jgi:hypothetical protein